MKFLLAFVSCCAPTVQRTSPNPAPEPDQENHALVRCKKRERQLGGRRRWRSGATSPATADQSWKPSLLAISEDRVVSVVSAGNNVNSGERSSGTDREKKQPRKVAGSRARVPAVDHGGELDFRQTVVPMVIPAFAPMASMALYY